ncbi:putative F-box protein At3g28280 [Papaver somniferum]|uniref:putative F-box protein At3g28280 n=1 Tax=Papaver somniferum TaxID=3469 RepID=UPI000E6F4A44|nr:putative F-box protein At3g28280 [Papaver somniferum]
MSSCSKANGDDLPPDVLYEIFIRLPLKQLYEFRCVSKLWNSLLSNPSFVRKHKVFKPWTIVYDRDEFSSRYPQQVFQTYSPNLHNNFINDHDGFSFQFLLKLDGSHALISKCEKQRESDNMVAPKVQLLASCVNGLVLYMLCPSIELFINGNLTLNVCNPLTKQCVSLPPRPSSLYWDFVSLVSESSVTSNYKVVCSYTASRNNITTLEIFSSDTGEWRSYLTYEVDKYKPIRSGFHSNMVICSGVLYWTDNLYRTNISDESDDADYELGVTACNLENKEIPKDTIWLIHLPEDIKRPAGGFFGVSEGSIYYGNVIHTTSNLRGFLSVWLLEDYSNGGWGWQSVHKNVEMKIHHINPYFDDFLFKFFCYLHPEDRNVIIVVETRFCLAYDISTRTYEVLRASPIPSSLVHTYPSFLPPLLITPKPTRIPLLLPSLEE